MFDEVIPIGYYTQVLLCLRSNFPITHYLNLLSSYHKQVDYQCNADSSSTAKKVPLFQVWMHQGYHCIHLWWTEQSSFNNFDRRTRAWEPAATGNKTYLINYLTANKGY